MELQGHSGGLTSAEFSPDGRHIVFASWNTTAWIWNTVTGECEVELQGHSDYLNSALFSSDGMHVVTASNDGTA